MVLYIIYYGWNLKYQVKELYLIGSRMLFYKELEDVEGRDAGRVCIGITYRSLARLQEQTNEQTPVTRAGCNHVSAVPNALDWTVHRSSVFRSLSVSLIDCPTLASFLLSHVLSHILSFSARLPVGRSLVSFVPLSISSPRLTLASVRERPVEFLSASFLLFPSFLSLSLSLPYSP